MKTLLSKSSDKASEGDPSPSDVQLVQRSQEGDTEAFGILVDRYKERVYRTIYQMTSHHEDADDLVQEAFIRAYRSIGKFQGKSSFYTWIYRIAVNLTLNHLKRSGRRRSFSLDDADSSIQKESALQDLFHSDTPSKGANLLDLRKSIHEALQRLTPNHRAVVTMHDIQGMTHGEIAKILGISEGTVRSRLHYARQQLQVYLSEFL